VSWFAVDDRFWSHRKVLALRASPHYADAVALWTLAGSWAAGQERERWTGRVPLPVLDVLGIAASRDALDALVDAELWTCDGDAVTFHEWDRWNGTGGREHRSKEQAAERKRAQRMRDCRNGRHSKDCPTTDGNGEPWECPWRTRHAASRDAGSGRAGTGRVGTGRVGSGRDGKGSTKASGHESDDAAPSWPDVPPRLRTPGGAS
jgi:hypothetical protein